MQNYRSDDMSGRVQVAAQHGWLSRNWALVSFFVLPLELIVIFGVLFTG